MSKPERRWNYNEWRWEKRGADGEWETEDWCSSITRKEFAKTWNVSGSVADVARELNWSRSKVKGQRTRTNKWFKDHGINYQLAELDDLTEPQKRQKTRQANSATLPSDFKAEEWGFKIEKVEKEDEKDGSEEETATTVKALPEEK